MTTEPEAIPADARFQGMIRSIKQWENMDPKAVLDGSRAQAEYALIDAKHDIAVLSHQLLHRASRAPVDGEIWRPIPGWESAYEVSNLGRVRSVDRQVPHGNGGAYLVNGSMLTPRPQMHGYLVVTLRKGEKVHITARVHRLVAAAFVPNPERKPIVNHIDCDPANNRAQNLEWCSQRENLAHMDELGRRAKPWLGKRSPSAILSDAQVRALRSRWEAGSVSFSQLAGEFNISKRAAMRCAKRETYSDVR